MARSPFCSSGSGCAGIITEITQQSKLDLKVNGTIADQPPRADAGNDRTIECTSSSGTPVTLSGSASVDPDGQGDIASYLWGWHVGGADSAATGPALNVVLPLGTTQFSLTVHDKRGASDIAGVRVTSQDTTPPNLALATPQPECLWAPNHKLVVYELGKDLGFTLSDVCDASPKVEILGVTSDQPDVGGGQGDFTPDVLSGKSGLCLRSERQGTVMWDREYTVRVRATDASMNQTTKAVVVRVPHDQSGAAKCPNVDPTRTVDASDPRCTKN